MPFHITCVCGRLTVVPDDAAGKTVRCSRCNSELEVPEVDAPQPPPAPSQVPADQPAIVVTPAPLPSRRQVRDPHKQAIQLVSAGVAILALLNTIPIVVAVRQPDSNAPATWLGGRVLEAWALAIILVTILQLVYLLYLLQLPDYSSLRMVSLLLLLISTSYALVLAVRLLASQGNGIMEMLGLDSNAFSSSQESLWCFLMTILTGVMSYVAGRAASRWRGEAGA